MPLEDGLSWAATELCRCRCPQFFVLLGGRRRVQATSLETPDCIKLLYLSLNTCEKDLRVARTQKFWTALIRAPLARSKAP